MVINVDFYKPSGKWYAGGLVDIGDAVLYKKEEFKQAIVDAQHILFDEWMNNSEFYVVTSPCKEDDDRFDGLTAKFVNALFLPHEFQGMKRSK